MVLVDYQTYSSTLDLAVFHMLRTRLKEEWGLQMITDVDYGRVVAESSCVDISPMFPNIFPTFL